MGTIRNSGMSYEEFKKYKNQGLSAQDIASGIEKGAIKPGAYNAGYANGSVLPDNGAGYNPSESALNAFYTLNTGGHTINPNQSYINFGDSGVLGKQDWLKQNPNMGGYGVPTEAVDSAYNSYVSDFAKQNNINTDGLDLANWESKRDEGNAWNDAHSGLSYEDAVYSYLAEQVENGTLTEQDAVYLLPFIQATDERNNPITFSEEGFGAYRQNQKDAALRAAFGEPEKTDDEMIEEYKNSIIDGLIDKTIVPGENLYDAIDDILESYSPDLIENRRIADMLLSSIDSELEAVGLDPITEEYMKHYNEDHPQAQAIGANGEALNIDPAYLSAYKDIQERKKEIEEEEKEKVTALLESTPGINATYENIQTGVKAALADNTEYQQLLEQENGIPRKVVVNGTDITGYEAYLPAIEAEEKKWALTDAMNPNAPHYATPEQIAEIEKDRQEWKDMSLIEKMESFGDEWTKSWNEVGDMFRVMFGGQKKHPESFTGNPAYVPDTTTIWH